MDVVSEGKVVAQSEDDRILALCEKWSTWHRSRRLFAPPVPKNILVRLQNLPGGEVPDAELSASASYFNLTLLAMPEGKPKEAFYLMYLHRVRPAKVVMDHLDMEKSQFYDMLKKFRRDTYRAYQRMLCG
jgi:hypothetical protein